MSNVSVLELRNHASEVIDRVERGELLMVIANGLEVVPVPAGE